MTDTEEKKNARLDPVLEESWAHKKGVFFRKEEFYLKPEMTKNGDAEKENGFYEIAKRFLKVNGCEPELVDAPKGFESQGISKGDKVWVIRGAEKIQKLKALFEKAKTNEDFRSLPQKESISGEPYPTNNDTIQILNGDYDNLDTLKKLIEKGGNPLFYNSSFGSALFHVPNVECAKFLLEQGVPLDCEYNGTTALFTARDKEIAKFLIEHGLSAQKKDISGRTALFTVENLEVAKYLVEEKGLNPKETDMFGRTALFTTQNSDIVNYLVKEKGVDVNHLDNDGQNALFHSYFRIGDELIKNGINVNQLDKKGKNVLFYTYSKASAQRLIKAGVKYKGITAQDAEKVEDIPGVKKALEDPDFQSVLEELGKNAQPSTSKETPGEKSETREETTDHEKIKDEYRKRIQELKDKEGSLTPDQYEQAKKDLEEWRKEQSIKDNLPTVEEALNPKITVSKAPSAQMEQDKNRTNGAAPSPGEKEPMSTPTETSDNSSPEDDKKKTNTGDEPERSNGDKPESESTNGESERNGENQEGHGSGSGTPPNSNPPTSGGDDEEDGNDEDHPISDGNKQENPGISDEDDEEEEEEERDEEDEEEEEGDEKKNNEHEDSPVTRIASKETEKKKERFSDAMKEAVDNFFKGTFDKDHKTAEDFAGDFLYNLLALPLDFVGIYLAKEYTKSEKDLLKEILEEMRKNKENEGNGEHGEKGGPAPGGSDEYRKRVQDNLCLIIKLMENNKDYPDLYQFLKDNIGLVAKGNIWNFINANGNIKNQFTNFMTAFAKTEGGQKILIEMFPDDYEGEHSPAALIALLTGENREDVDVKGSRINIHNINNNNNNNGSNGNGGQSETVRELLDVVKQMAGSDSEKINKLIDTLNKQNEQYQKLIDGMDQRRDTTEKALEEKREQNRTEIEKLRLQAEQANEQRRIELEKQIREREIALEKEKKELEERRMQHDKEMAEMWHKHDKEMLETISQNMSTISDEIAKKFTEATKEFTGLAKEQLATIKEQSKGLTEAQKELSKAIGKAVEMNLKAAEANKTAAEANKDAAKANQTGAEANKAAAEANKANGDLFISTINAFKEEQTEAMKQQIEAFQKMLSQNSADNKDFIKQNNEFLQKFFEKMYTSNTEAIQAILKEGFNKFAELNKGDNGNNAFKEALKTMKEILEEQEKTKRKEIQANKEIALKRTTNRRPSGRGGSNGSSGGINQTTNVTVNVSGSASKTSQGNGRKKGKTKESKMSELKQSLYDRIDALNIPDKEKSTRKGLLTKIIKQAEKQKIRIDDLVEIQEQKKDLLEKLKTTKKGDPIKDEENLKTARKITKDEEKLKLAYRLNKLFMDNQNLNGESAAREGDSIAPQIYATFHGRGNGQG